MVCVTSNFNKARIPLPLECLHRQVGVNDGGLLTKEHVEAFSVTDVIAAIHDRLGPGIPLPLMPPQFAYS